MEKYRCICFTSVSVCEACYITLLNRRELHSTSSLLSGPRLMFSSLKNCPRRKRQEPWSKVFLREPLKHRSRGCRERFHLPLLRLCLRAPVAFQTCPNTNNSARLRQSLLFVPKSSQSTDLLWVTLGSGSRICQGIWNFPDRYWVFT